MTLGTWALVAASAVAWGLKVLVRPAAVPAGTPVAEMAPAPQAELTRLLGADPPPVAQTAETTAEPPPESDRFTLLGVVAPRGPGAARSREGVALIAVDDRPPRAFRIGAAVDGETVLQSVSQRGVELGPRGGPARVALQLPAPEPAATGSLPALAPPQAGVPPRGPAPVPPFARPGAPRPPMPGVPTPAPQPAEPDGQSEPVELAPPQPRGNAPTLM